MSTLLTDEMRSALMAHDIEKVKELAEEQEIESRRYAKRCRICGRKFFTNWANQVVCSTECAKKNKNALPLKRAKTMVQRTCPVCGKTFEACRTSSKKYCGKECMRKARTRISPGDNRKVCPVCGKEFFARKDTQVCCSHVCAWQYRKGVRVVREESHGTRECERCSRQDEPGSIYCKRHIRLEMKKISL